MSDIKSSFATGHIKGEKPKPAAFELGVPYKGQTLTGDALQTQLDKWVRLGVIELSAGAQISQVARSASGSTSPIATLFCSAPARRWGRSSCCSSTAPTSSPSTSTAPRSGSG